MTWSEEEIAALKAAIASGILRVAYAGPPARDVTYQSLADMRALLAEMIADVRGSVLYRRTKHERGFRR